MNAPGRLNRTMRFPLNKSFVEKSFLHRQQRKASVKGANLVSSKCFVRGERAISEVAVCHDRRTLSALLSRLRAFEACKTHVDVESERCQGEAMLVNKRVVMNASRCADVSGVRNHNLQLRSHDLIAYPQASLQSLSPLVGHQSTSSKEAR